MKHRRINILFVLPSLRYTGAETQAVNLINGLLRRTFNIHAVIFQEHLDQLAKLDTRTITFYMCPRRFKFDTAIIKKIADIIRREDIRIIHCTNQIAFLFAFLGRLISGRKSALVATLHTTIHRSVKNEIFDRLLYSPLMIFANRIITVSRNQKRHWIKKYPWLAKRMVTIHNGVDVDAFRDRMTHDRREVLREKLHLRPEDFVVVLAAEFRPEKGHDTAFMAVNKVKRQGKNIKLVLLGDGEKTDELRTLARQLHMEEDIRWEGYQKDIRPYLGICDVVLISSFAESFSMTMLEAMAAGRPVISTRVGGADELIVESRNGMLVEPGDPNPMGEALEFMIANADLCLKMGQSARDSVVREYEVGRMVEKTAVLLEGMIPNGDNHG